jgi:hypothetical protein
LQLTKTKKTSKKRIYQGDILRDVEYIEYVCEKAGVVEISKISFPVAVVLTQDCDLEQDYKLRKNNTSTQDKLLMSVLMAPLYNAEHVYCGEHLSDLGITMASINKKKTPGDFLRNNERSRYHYLEFPANVPIVPSVVDFKHYFSCNLNYLRQLKETHFICALFPLFREQIAHRFASYLARIGLPGVKTQKTRCLPDSFQQ